MWETDKGDKGLREGLRERWGEGGTEGGMKGGRALHLMDPEAAKPGIISEKGACQKSITILSVSL